eukprot:760353-Hanusia_phi.AAC.3
MTGSREVRKLFKGISFTVLRLVRTQIGSIIGPCEQEISLSGRGVDCEKVNGRVGCERPGE